MRKLFGVLMLAAGLVAGGGISGIVRAQDPEPEEPTVFPDGEHRDEAFYYCTACHSSALVRAQGHSRDRWAEVLQIMVEKHSMVPLEGEDRDKMLDYLAKAFPPKGRAYSNPFLKSN